MLLSMYVVMTGTKIPPKNRYPHREINVYQKSVMNGSGDADAVAKKVTTNKNGTTFLEFVPINFVESGPLSTAPSVGLEIHTTAKPVWT